MAVTSEHDLALALVLALALALALELALALAQQELAGAVAAPATRQTQMLIAALLDSGSLRCAPGHH